MEASNAADIITNAIKNSKLNFYMQETPFSLLINVRKSFIKTKSGHDLVNSNDNYNSSEANTKHQEKVEKLEQEKSALSESLAVLESELQDSRNVGDDLSIKLEEARKEIAELLGDRNNNVINVEKLRKLVDEAKVNSKDLEAKNRDLEKQIETFQNDKNSANKIVKLREKEIVRLQSKTENLEDLVKNKKAENKILVEEKNKLIREKNISASKPQKLLHKTIATNTVPASNIEVCTQTENKKDPPNMLLYSTSTVNPVQALPTLCPPTQTSSSMIVNEELSENANIAHSTQCSSLCQHSMQCIIREPFPPPSPSITYLYNESSKYHQHMMLWSKKEFAGHAKCFSIDNENYGCSDCTFLKWWYKWHGDTHGFPDIAEWTYKKYL